MFPTVSILKNCLVLLRDLLKLLELQVPLEPERLQGMQVLNIMMRLVLVILQLCHHPIHQVDLPNHQEQVLAQVQELEPSLLLLELKEL